MTARVVVATHDAVTVAAITTALDEHAPVALLHAKLSATEHADQRAQLAAASAAPDDALVLFTSGTTATARGVVLSRAALDAAAAASWTHLGRRDDDRWLCALPLAHAGGLSIIVRCRAARVPFVLADHRALADQLDDITLLSLVPAQLAALLDDPAWRPSPRLRAVLLGGAAAAPALVRAALARGVPVLQTYGLTETFGQVATARTPGGALVPLPGVELIAGTSELPAAIRVRGPMLATRYLDGTPIAPELVTSDLGIVRDGVLDVIGRIDDVIISGGENIHPTTVEAVLAATPGVRDALAFGIADDRWGHVVAAALTVDAGFDPARARSHWHDNLPAHARPRRIALVHALPRLASGKPDRRALAAITSSPVDYAS